MGDTTVWATTEPTEMPGTAAELSDDQLDHDDLVRCIGANVISYVLITLTRRQ
ncbi:hypothetical protein [Nocardia grenadensis]|uniref:hypothetical protein n=1 Tax=Nocardia grenadensis TaxID=931537 RepID=UPI000B0E4D6C|nr:hypothetical protein [Nocardia grenadensis]